MENSTQYKINAFIKNLRVVLILFSSFLFSCDLKQKEDRDGKSVYVSPTIDKRGHFRKGYIRKSVSNSKDAVKNQNRSRYYYHTRGKYRRKSRKD
jgi:hypothetical protein